MSRRFPFLIWFVSFHASSTFTLNSRGGRNDPLNSGFSVSPDATSLEGRVYSTATYCTICFKNIYSRTGRVHITHRCPPPPTLARTKPPSPRSHLYTEKRVVLRNRVCFYMRSLFLHKLLKEDSYCLQTRQLHRNLLCTLYGPTVTHRRRQRQSAHQGRLWFINGYCKRRDMLKILLLILHTSLLFFGFY